MYPGGYREFLKYYDEKHQHLLKKIYSIQEIKQSVTGVIKKRIATDHHEMMHFEMPYYPIILWHYSSKKIASRTSSRNGKGEDLKSTKAEDKRVKGIRKIQRVMYGNNKMIPSFDIPAKN